MAVIETEGLTRRFWTTDAIKGLTLQVPEGSVFALLGANGAGKTTTMKLLMNLLRPTRGRARVLGCDSRALGVRERQRIGYVSENQKLPEWMTAAQLMAYCRPLYPSWDDRFAQSLQSALGLTAPQRIAAMSRGTKMKAALLSSLAYHPELVLLDEPFTGLDPVVRDELVRALLEACAERTATVFISSHDIDEVERLADWIGFLDGGRLLFAEPTASLLSRFRLVEAIGETAAPPVPTDSRWLVQGVSGRTVRVIDTAHDRPDTDARITAAFPAAEVRTSPLSLRDIFVAIARRNRPSERKAL